MDTTKNLSVMYVQKFTLFQDGLSRHVKNCHPEFRNIGYSNFQKVFEANSSKTEDNTVSERFMDCEICCFR